MASSQLNCKFATHTGLKLNLEPIPKGREVLQQKKTLFLSKSNFERFLPSRTLPAEPEARHTADVFATR